MVGRIDCLKVWNKAQWDEETQAILELNSAILEQELSSIGLRL